jgi:hypothetical protein
MITPTTQGSRSALDDVLVVVARRAVAVVVLSMATVTVRLGAVELVAVVVDSVVEIVDELEGEMSTADVVLTRVSLVGIVVAVVVGRDVVVVIGTSIVIVEFVVVVGAVVGSHFAAFFGKQEQCPTTLPDGQSKQLVSAPAAFCRVQMERLLKVKTGGAPMKLF